MKNDNFLIVGGGVTGCIAAMLLAKKNISVTLCEATSTLGGILKDQAFDDDYFFSSCQYFSPSAKWFELLPAELGKHLYTFPHQYGSYTEFKNSHVTSEDFAIPVFDNNFVNFNEFSRTLDNETLFSRLSIYPDNISTALCKWVTNYGIDPRTVCGENSLALQIARIHALGGDDQIAEMKKKSHFDDVLALSHKKMNPNQVISGALPFNGYDVFFTQFRDTLVNMGVNVLTNTPVKARKHREKLEFLSRSEVLGSFSSVIWAANPVPLITCLGLPKLDNFYGKSETHFFSIPTLSIVDEPRYYQVFSDQSPINRVYLYSLLSKSMLTVECFSGETDKDKVKEYTEKILLKYGFNNKLEWRGLRKDKRYIFFSPKDKQILQSLTLNEHSKNCEIIDAGWLDYGRDAKIERIISQIV